MDSTAWNRLSSLPPDSGGLMLRKRYPHCGPGGVMREDNKLADAVTGSLRVADELKLTSVAMPAISTGIYGFPKERAAKIIFSAIEKYFESNKSNLKVVKLVLFDQATVDVFIKSWQDKWTMIKSAKIEDQFVRACGTPKNARGKDLWLRG